MELKYLRGRVAMVTGGASGMGRAMAVGITGQDHIVSAGSLW
ncbi:MAG: hypothetical protein ACLFM0_05735 [Spirochaetales bacterium]